MSPVSNNIKGLNEDRKGWETSTQLTPAALGMGRIQVEKAEKDFRMAQDSNSSHLSQVQLEKIS